MPTARPSDAMSARPRTICMVASVVISALMRKRAMTTPLTVPTRPPHTRAATRPSRIDPVAFEAMTATMPEKATVEPTERSKSREARQNIMVQATMPMVTTDCSRPSMFRSVRKLGTVSDTTAKASAKMTTRPCSPRRSFFKEVIVTVPVREKECLSFERPAGRRRECAARRTRLWECRRRRGPRT